MKRISEILNALEKMVDDLYEVGNDDAQYFEEMIGEAMDLILESDQRVERLIYYHPYV